RKRAGPPLLRHAVAASRARPSGGRGRRRHARRAARTLPRLRWPRPHAPARAGDLRRIHPPEASVIHPGRRALLRALGLGAAALPWIPLLPTHAETSTPARRLV